MVEIDHKALRLSNTVMANPFSRCIPLAMKFPLIRQQVKSWSGSGGSNHEPLICTTNKFRVVVEEVGLKAGA
jgi:hypothetical protein